ncbi:hypothetical protein BDU57DRAFT_26782 [Ampelomyces quisqualis]|uniref:Uncharacterized protein n=1 Tax=Ampelomyces quisqualis TaxID=50730 RepID=A0A6A5R127_AMPQU|nr:hypothetical protein BDU57DRAFT_26782 [Ampelomyces quisqualis]
MSPRLPTPRATEVREKQTTRTPLDTNIQQSSACSSPVTHGQTRLCISCGECYLLHEFPAHVATSKCRHENAMCAYCLHNSVYAQYWRSQSWEGITCPVCLAEMSGEEGRECVLLWMGESQEG